MVQHDQELVDTKGEEIGLFDHGSLRSRVEVRVEYRGGEPALHHDLGRGLGTNDENAADSPGRGLVIDWSVRIGRVDVLNGSMAKDGNQLVLVLG